MNISLPTWLRMKSSSCPNSSSKESCRWNFYLSSFCSAGKHGRQRLGWMNSKSIRCSHHIVDILTGWKIGKALIFSSCISLILHVYAKNSTWVFGSVNCPLLSWSHDLFQWTLTLNLNYLEASTLLTPDTFRKKRQFKYHWRNFSGGPMVKTSHSQCRVSGFHPWSGN